MVERFLAFLHEQEDLHELVRHLNRMYDDVKKSKKSKKSKTPKTPKKSKTPKTQTPKTSKKQRAIVKKKRT